MLKSHIYCIYFCFSLIKVFGYLVNLSISKEELKKKERVLVGKAGANAYLYYFVLFDP
jgi:hypothetical protein